jgi:prepilin-type N-terminal cleavage/methylation domain-containing protein/prepilin-type processing-associated H-X9-DG protein
MTRRRRFLRPQGFTLIELLVVISIIGVLVGLLLPAIGAAREAGRRAQCQSNLHNVTLGILGYVNQRNVFPPAGEFCETAVNPQNPDPTTSGIPTWLPGGTGSSGVPMYSWVVPILPYLDQQDMSDQWSMWVTPSGQAVSIPVPYFDAGTVLAQQPGGVQPGQLTNLKIGQTGLKILVCPDDNTVQPQQGNLSYVVNTGFALWHVIPAGWNPLANGAQFGDGTGGPVQLKWGIALSGAPQWVADMANTQKLGVMFLESTFPQGITGRIPWNVRSSMAGVTDGSSATIMISENTLAGVGGTSPYAPAGLGGETNWATTNSNINGGKSLTLEGSYPFSNSGHPAGCNMGFCDGAVRFISNTIDGTVYSKIITPAGAKLPVYLKQFPVEQDAFINN